MWPMLSVVTTILSALATVFAGFLLYHLHRRFVPRQEHELLAEQQAEHGQRLEALERRMATVPDSKDMYKLKLAIEEIRGDHKAMRAQLDGMKDSLEVIGRNVNMLVRSHMKE